MFAGLAALSFLAAFLLVRLLLSRFARFGLDQPNARSLHEAPVPRTGGIAVLSGAALALAFGAGPVWLRSLRPARRGAAGCPSWGGRRARLVHSLADRHA
jgi:UDP-N-acetylmuramyl pentapeptide phosphotransferase/UDP-N-acetylglucosamine-1-phosphate transferase